VGFHRLQAREDVKEFVDYLRDLLGIQF